MDRRLRARRLELRVEPFVELGPSQHAELEAEAARIGTFLNVPVALTVRGLD